MGCAQTKTKKQQFLETLDTNISTYGSQKALSKLFNNQEQKKEKFKIHLNPIVMRRSQSARQISINQAN